MDTKFRAPVVWALAHWRTTMLHDPSHYTPMPLAEEIILGRKDKDVLRQLAGELAAKPKTVPKWKVIGLKSVISSALCHVANISYRLGQSTSVDAIKEAVMLDANTKDSFERFTDHLAANQVNAQNTRPFWGRA